MQGSDYEVVRLLDALYAPDEAMIWIDTPQQLLDDKTPRSLIDAGNAQRVVTLLQQILEGAYT